MMLKSQIRMSTHRPYEIPRSLDELHGPGLGSVLCLNHSIIWAPDSQTIELHDLDDVHFAYTALINNGTSEDQEHFMNRDLLLNVWPKLFLPWRVYRLWQEAFPELPANRFNYV